MTMMAILTIMTVMTFYILKVMHEMTACYNVSVSCTGQGMVAQVIYDDFEDDIGTMYSSYIQCVS